MAYELVQAIIPYKQVFRYPSPKRKLWSNWFGESVDLRIEVVDSEEAPVAYEVRFGPDDAPGLLGYQIKSYQGGLWWPMGGDFNYVLHPESFATAMNDGHPQTLVLLDPSFAGCTERRPLRAFPERCSRVDHDSNNLANQQALAQRGASTTIFCAEGTYVRAGEPVFYAVPDDGENRKSVSIVVGVSDPKRETDCTSLSGPGPTRSDRMSCARRGFAFGIGEIDEAVRALEARGYAVKRNYGIDVLLERHRADTAPMMCAREVARSLFVESDKAELRAARLREQVPVVGGAINEEQVDDLCVEALRQLCASNDPIVAFGFRAEIRAAKAILGRLGIGALAPDDDDALGKLGPG
jgi:hypothetical protein